MRALLLVPALLLAGCQKDFDQQFAETEKRLKADAERLDKQMTKEAEKEPGEGTKD